MSSRLEGRPPDLADQRRQGAHVVEMQRHRLLLALVEVAEEGLENASIGRICKRASVSRRTFYEIFEDRDECLVAAFDAAVERLAQPVLATYHATGGSWRQRIRRALASLLEQLDAEPHAARLCVVETLTAGPRIAERRSRVLSALVAAVEQGRSEAPLGNEPPPLTGQGVVGGALSVVQARLLEAPSAAGHPRRLSDLTGSLMAMIVHPYLGSAAARRELRRPTSKRSSSGNGVIKDPFKGLSIRFTYRTARVLATIAADPGASNRMIADISGIADEGQMSRLLTRLLHAGLVQNRREAQAKGEANAWVLTERGGGVQAALAGR